MMRSGNLFVVQWDSVHLKDREDEGPFTFQAVLQKNGTIVFNYKDVSKKGAVSSRRPLCVCGGIHSGQTGGFSGPCAAGEDQFHGTSSQSGTVGRFHGSPFSTALGSAP